MISKSLRILAAVAIVAGGLAFTQTPAGAATVIDIHVGSFYFEDSTVGDGVINAKVGDQLRFTFDDNGAHTAEVDELGISSGAQGAGAVFVTAPLTQAGTFTLYCKPHRNRGHLTTLVVSENNPPPTTTTITPTTVTTTTAPPTTTTTTRSSTTSTATTSSTTSTTTAGGGGVSSSTTLGNSTTSTAASSSSTTSLGESNTNTTSQGSDGDPSTAVDGADAPATSSHESPGSDGLAFADTPETTESATSDAAPAGSKGEIPSSDEQATELLPTGVVTPASKAWLRSVWAGLRALVPIALLAVGAFTRKSPEATPNPALATPPSNDRATDVQGRRSQHQR